MQARTLVGGFGAAVIGLATVLAPVFSWAGPAEQIRTKLETINPQVQIVSVAPAPLDGIYAVELASGEVLYSSENGDYFLLGQLYQVQEEGFVNLTDQRKKVQRKAALDNLKREDLVVFSPEGPVKAVLHAFTDVDCGYCRKLHSEMADYNKLGIEIRYLAFPRAGIDSSAYRKMVSVWCADNRQAAMTASKAGRFVEEKTCDNPVAAQYELGQVLGVNGTPSLLLEDGSMMPGYVPAERLAGVLGIN